MTSLAEKPLPPWALGAAGALVGITVVLLGARFGIGASFVVLAGVALIAVVWLAFRAVQAIVEPEGEVDIGRAPTPAQMQQQAAMRALRDLEYERSIGNVSDEDYRELERRYREEAKRAMRAVDEERRAMREKAETIVREALGGSEPAKADAKIGSKPRAKEADKKQCAECATENDADAKFCKNCGAKSFDARAKEATS